MSALECITICYLSKICYTKVLRLNLARALLSRLHGKRRYLYEDIERYNLYAKSERFHANHLTFAKKFLYICPEKPSVCVNLDFYF